MDEIENDISSGLGMIVNDCFFFFQAEDGIRDYKVTGVQTCALPICGMRGVPQNSLCASRAAQTTAASQMTKQACPSAGLPPRIPPNAGVGRRGEAGGSQQPTANSQQPALSIRSASNGGRAKRRPAPPPRMSAPAAWWVRGCRPAEGQDCFVI